MERSIPNLDKIVIINYLTGFKKENNSKYLELIEEFEKKCEKSLIETFARVDIKAMVKTDRYSLPYKEEKIITLKGESYVNGAFEFYRVARHIVKEILNKDIYKLRFYLFINVEEGNFGFGKVKYCFRYYPHSNK